MKRGALASMGMCVVAAGCAFGGGGSLDAGSAGVMRTTTLSPGAAQAAVRSGNSKSEVAQALGRANVIAFDSGWEVWVYRWPGADRSTRAATEFVVLFDDKGVVRKVRTRQGA